MKKRIFSMLLVLTMLLSLCTNFAYAAGNATLTVNAGEITNGKVEVSVDLSNNPGIASLGFTLNYDNTKLVPETYEKFSILGFGNCVSNYDQGKAMDSYEFASYFFGGTSNSTANGTLLKITFLVKSGDWEETPLDIVVASGEIADQNYNDVAVDLVDSSVGLPIIDYTFADATKTYNGSVQALTATGFKDASGKTLSGVTVTYENNENKDAGTHTVKAIAKKDGYRTVTKTATLTINPKELTITGLSANNKAYDSSNVATLTGGTLNGKIGSDDVSVTMPTSATFSSANVANNVSVNIPNIELKGSAKNNYTLKQPTGIKANITAAPITVTADAKSKRVGTTDPELTYTYTGQLYGSDTFTGKLSRQSGETVGKYDITQGTLSLGNNYKITYNKAIFEIVDKTPQNITVSAITSKTYGDAPFTVTVTPDAVSGLSAFTYESSNTDVAEISNDGTVTIKAAGKTNITVKQAGNEEYATFVKTQELVVNKVEIVVTADAKSKRVGTDDPALTYQYTGTLVGADAFTGELSRQSGETVGAYDILQGTLALSDNYKITYNKATFEILAKIVQNITVSTITEKTYGDTPFAVTVTPDAVSGLSDFTFESSNTEVAEISNDGIVTIKAAGKTNITVKQAGNIDYAEFVKTQELIVNKVEIVVTADAKSKRIGTDDPALTYQYTGALVGEDTFTGELSRQSGEEIGTYDILQGTLALSDNYNITYNKAVFEILEKTPQNIVIADIPVKTYGDTSFALTVTPDATANLTSFTYDSSDKNVATVDASGNVTIVGAGETIISVTESGNEDFAKTTVTKKLTVNKKALEIKVDNVTITYGDAINTNITYTGFIDGEDETVLTKAVEVSGYSAKPNVGEHDIILSGAEVANYEISYVNAKLTVNKKDVTVTQLKVFDKVADTTTDATINTSSLVIDGMILGDDVTINFENAVATFATAEVGTDIAVTITALELVGTHAENYNLTNTEITTVASIKETITASDIAAQITALSVVKDSTELTLPNVPAGYKVTVKSSDNEDVVKTDGSVAPVENDTQVGLIFTVTNEADETDVADTTVINVTIPASTKISVVVTAEENGTVTGSGEYLKNSDVTVVATPDSGYKFSAWYNGEASVSTNASYTFKAESNVTLVAKFAKKTSSGGGGGSSSYVVKFETNGGSKVTSQSLRRNAVVKEPTAPTKDGYTFEGWYTDKELTTVYDFETKVTKGFTLYAKWTEVKTDVENPDETEKPNVSSSLPFEDVKTDDWFYDSVKYVYENGLMKGTSDTVFSSNTDVTRAMFVTVLYRMENEPDATTSIFDDVESGSWYEKAVAWANANGIVKGVSDTSFAPNDSITREQMATIVYRYAQFKGYDVSDVTELNYSDSDNISEYAKDAVVWASANSIMNGNADNTFAPKSNTTRVQAAAVFMRVIENLK